MSIIEPTPSQAAVVLKKFLATEGHELKLNVAQEAIARTRGYASFQALAATVPLRGAPVAKTKVQAAIEADERIFTVKLKGTQRQVLVELVAEARELAQIRARDTTPRQQAEQEARDELLGEAQAELTDHARCYEEEASGKPASRTKPSSSPVLKSAVGDQLWEISGRNHGDDDDTVELIWAKDLADATVKFKLCICEYSDLPQLYAFEDDLDYPIYVNTTTLVGELVNGQFILHKDVLPLAEGTSAAGVDVSAMSLEDVEYELREEHDAHQDEWERLAKNGSSFGKMVTSMAKEPGYRLHEHAKRFLELTAASAN